MRHYHAVSHSETKHICHQRKTTASITLNRLQLHLGMCEWPNRIVRRREKAVEDLMAVKEEQWMDEEGPKVL